MPFLLALVPTFTALGLAANTAAGSPLVTPDLHEHPPEFPPSSLRLGIRGRICLFHEKSTHMMAEDSGEWKNIGNCFYMKEGATPDFLETFRGIPILAPNLKTEVGTVTRAYAECEDFMVEGTIRDSEAARWTMSGQKAGLCLALRNTKKCSGPADQFSGTYECVPMNLRICLPGQSGFASSYVKFTDATITLQDSEKPRSVLPWMDGHGW
jgi:hypothetical protein